MSSFNKNKRITIQPRTHYNEYLMAVWPSDIIPVSLVSFDFKVLTFEKKSAKTKNKSKGNCQQRLFPSQRYTKKNMKNATQDSKNYNA